MRWTRGSSSGVVSVFPLRTFRVQAGVTTPTIGMNYAAGLNGIADECVLTLSGGIQYLPQPDAPNAPAILLSGRLKAQRILVYRFIKR